MLIVKTRAFKVTNTVNAAISQSTGIFWGYLFDVLIFAKIVDVYSVFCDAFGDTLRDTVRAPKASPKVSLN